MTRKGVPGKGQFVFDELAFERTLKKFAEWGYLDDPDALTGSSFQLLGARPPSDCCQYCGKELQLSAWQRIVGGLHFCSGSHKACFYRKLKPRVNPAKKIIENEKRVQALLRENYKLKQDVFAPIIKGDPPELRNLKRLVRVALGEEEPERNEGGESAEPPTWMDRYAQVGDFDDEEL